MAADFRLKVFSSVARNLSFTKAAQELFISQPAITKHIHELETLYQTRLFERLGSKIELTAGGKLLLDHCDKILDEYARLDYEMNLLRNKIAGKIKLGASTTIAQYVLPLILPRFIERFPEVSVTLLNGNSAEIEKDLQEHRIDLAIVEGNIKQPALKYYPFMEDELVLISRTNTSQWNNVEEITIDELKTIPLILRERGSGTLDVILSALSKYNIKLSDLNVIMHLGSTESIKLFLENSECMSIVSIRSIMDELYENRVKIIEIKDISIVREFNFVRLQGEEGGLSTIFMDYALHYKQKL